MNAGVQSVSLQAWLAGVEAALRPLADAQGAQAMAAYMKGQFPFLGVPTPARRLATASWVKAPPADPVAAAQALWTLPEREFTYVACDLLRREAKRLPTSSLPDLAALACQRPWWDSVDSLVPTVACLIRRDPSWLSTVEDWIEGDGLWLKRMALLHQLDAKRDTDASRLFAHCLRCADEPDFFIRKAIGWALRQHARTDPDAVRRFLQGPGACLSALSRREAAKHLG